MALLISINIWMVEEFMATGMQKMPTLFIGHGSPTNAIEDNKYTRAWVDIAKLIPKPTAILAISAHWYTVGTKIMDEAKPKMIMAPGLF